MMVVVVMLILVMMVMAMRVPSHDLRLSWIGETVIPATTAVLGMLPGPGSLVPAIDFSSQG